ncbi:MAG TPA: tryptophan synthase subunit alpha, partial [Burkholderiales bacterium]|nr:tryptophan synthase subunit alpha [Burkholderiales bacterium]
MNRIGTAFKRLKRDGKKALIPFITAGDPHPSMTVSLMHALVDAGADVIELGVPFSDPMSDGPVIQHASERALKFGTSLKDILGMVSEFRKKDDGTPVVLMGYLNPFEAMGYEKFAIEAKRCGVDGVLTVDCPPEEAEALLDAFSRQGIEPIFLLSPTTSGERIVEVGKYASGYVYYVSLKGVTGATHLDFSEIEERVGEIRKSIDLPVCIGFGIRDEATAKAAARIADGIVIGSRIVKEIESS